MDNKLILENKFPKKFKKRLDKLIKIVYNNYIRYQTRNE